MNICKWQFYFLMTALLIPLLSENREKWAYFWRRNLCFLTKKTTTCVWHQSKLGVQKGKCYCFVDVNRYQGLSAQASVITSCTSPQATCHVTPHALEKGSFRCSWQGVFWTVAQRWKRCSYEGARCPCETVGSQKPEGQALDPDLI